MTTNDERERQADIDPEHPVGRVEEDHRTLRSQLEAAATATTPSDLMSGLADLPKMLSEHFSLEEQVGGLYDDLRSRRPALASDLDSLRTEHQVILDEFDALRRELQAQVDAEQSAETITETMRRDLTRWLERLHFHERKESEMIGDVYYTDEGGFG